MVAFLAFCVALLAVLCGIAIARWMDGHIDFDDVEDV